MAFKILQAEIAGKNNSDTTNYHGSLGIAEQVICVTGLWALLHFYWENGRKSIRGQIKIYKVSGHRCVVVFAAGADGLTFHYDGMKWDSTNKSAQWVWLRNIKHDSNIVQPITVFFTMMVNMEKQKTFV